MPSLCTQAIVIPTTRDTNPCLAIVCFQGKHVAWNQRSGVLHRRRQHRRFRVEHSVSTRCPDGESANRRGSSVHPSQLSVRCVTYLHVFALWFVPTASALRISHPRAQPCIVLDVTIPMSLSIVFNRHTSSKSVFSSWRCSLCSGKASSIFPASTPRYNSPMAGKVINALCFCFCVAVLDRR